MWEILRVRDDADGRYAAMETAFANVGQLSASHAEVWNSAAAVRLRIGARERARSAKQTNLTRDHHARPSD
ncbi:hypothetical protein CIC12_11985 [Burkholderia sp. SG-MS1]|nr:hypothetical protein [Paraburkholderia sp. SG-MS1]